MSDNELRNLEKEAKLNPGDETLQARWLQARMRSGEKSRVFWKIKEKKTGQFATGKLNATFGYSSPTYFSKEGKEWSDKDEVYKYLKRVTEKAEKERGAFSDNLLQRIKNSDIIEYRVMECSRSSGAEELERAELEHIRIQKEESLKKLKALEEKEKSILERRTEE